LPLWVRHELPLLFGNRQIVCVLTHLRPDTMKRDMVDERPLWPLSSYAAAKNAPNLLADLDLSSDELRVRAYEAQKSSQMQQYVRLLNPSRIPRLFILSGGI
jgi:hypothetical protein